MVGYVLYGVGIVVGHVQNGVENSGSINSNFLNKLDMKVCKCLQMMNFTISSGMFNVF